LKKCKVGRHTFSGVPIGPITPKKKKCCLW
jgi:hypothetical protein